MEIAVHLAVTGDVFNGVSLCCLFYHGASDDIWEIIESVSEGFSITFSYGVMVSTCLSYQMEIW